MDATVPWGAHALYVALWASFGLGHSVFANRGVKRRLAGLGRWYRLAYNAIATVHIGLVFGLGLWLLGDAPAFDLPGIVRGAMLGGAVLGVALLLWSSRYYDMARLAGLRQIREPDAPEDEALRLDGPHRFVRHPFYASGLLIVWGLALSPFGLATALWASAYLVIGAAVEERRLLRRYGAAYAAYRRRIPGFIPAPLLGRRPLPAGE
ncbi:methyltransferase family protein [Roseospira goensis]|uniref:Protein-S-isoprenylcysteine O-methyltransferase Ste14 n=1 Tax=Roseospira goensis TaxID=391922 RepID=A0A7W6WKT7_9PROT|nr:isoprenylcysteine carboxylmethyltransferase family protein [Roseospira goensis]MBB4286696.1 protein-S-isoprenylcysteine O-methyltransferase Ste14 [Roseospira goensis]